MTVMDASNGQNVSIYQVYDYGDGRNLLSTLSWTPDEKNVVAGSDDGVYMWQAT
jgi:hypothetical protein